MRAMYRRGLIVVLCSCNLGLASAADLAAQWLREDAPHVYLVRQSDPTDYVVSRFVRQAHHWDQVWCPHPAADSQIAPGDLLVRVRINGRSWVQRARRADGSFPHAQELTQYQPDTREPFVFVPRPDVHPVQRIDMDPGVLSVHEPEQSVRGEVLEVWETEAKDQIMRVSQGKRQHVKQGTALLLVPSASRTETASWRRAVVVFSLLDYSYALLLDSGVTPDAGDEVRGPMAWCAAS